MAEYTYKDVIIDPDDPRVEIGRRYWFADTPRECLWRANTAKKTWNLIVVKHDDDNPFVADGIDSACIILAKEPEKKYVPFDLSKEEDRARLRGAWIRRKDYPGDEYQIVGISITNNLIFFDDSAQLSTDVLLKRCEFVDGSPCGKLVEEE